MRQIASWQDIQLALDALERGLELRAVTTVPKPRAKAVVLYAKVNGSGKLELRAQFPTGAAQLLATEP